MPTGGRECVPRFATRVQLKEHGEKLPVRRQQFGRSFRDRRWLKTLPEGEKYADGGFWLPLRAVKCEETPVSGNAASGKKPLFSEVFNAVLSDKGQRFFLGLGLGSGLGFGFGLALELGFGLENIGRPACGRG